MTEEANEPVPAESGSADVVAVSEPQWVGLEERRPFAVEAGDPPSPTTGAEAGVDPGDAVDADAPHDVPTAEESDGDDVIGTRIARAGEAGPDGPSLHAG